MSLTAQDRINHDLYESMSKDDRDAVDAAFKECIAELKVELGDSFKPSMADPAESLVAAIASFVHASRESQRRTLARAQEAAAAVVT